MTPAITLNSLSNDQLQTLLLSGAVGIIPTDTVYGLVCRAADITAVSRLYALKNRENKPGTVMAASIDQLVELGIKKRYLTAVEQFWPGPISIVIPNHELSYLHLGVGGLACRVIDGPEGLLNVLSNVGPLLSSSANHPGERPATNIQEAVGYFGDAVDFYVDGGDLSDRESSTVIRVVDDAVEVLREGAVKIDETGRITK